MSSATTAASMLLRQLPITAGPRAIEDWLEDLIIDHRWAADLSDAQVLAERWSARCLGELRSMITDYSKLGRPVKVAFNSVDRNLVQGAAYIEPNDPPEVIMAKHSRVSYDAYQAALARLSPDDFEVLCGGLLDLLTAKDIIVTQRSADEGIDFYGRLHLEQVVGDNPFRTVVAQMKVWLIGQAKRYSASRACTPDIRELVGSIVLARGKAFGSGDSDKYASLDPKVCDPIYYLFITTGQITAHGWQLLQRSGVIGMDGEMVAAFLANHKRATTAGGYDQAMFDQWMSTLRSRYRQQTLIPNGTPGNLG